MTSTKVIDLDSKLAFVEDEPLHIKTIKLFGQEIRVICDLNQFALGGVIGESVDPSAVRAFIRSLIHPDDWPAFNSAATSAPALRGEKGGENWQALLTSLMEVVTENPTKRPSDLPRGASTRSSVRKLPANSGSARAKASPRSR